jgi:hypothetical protein
MKKSYNHKLLQSGGILFTFHNLFVFCNHIFLFRMYRYKRVNDFWTFFQIVGTVTCFFFINTHVLFKNCLLKFTIHVELSFVSVVILAVKALRGSFVELWTAQRVYKNRIFVFVRPCFCVDQFFTCREL